jgi:hypothetical protein
MTGLRVVVAEDDVLLREGIATTRSGWSATVSAKCWL